MYSSMRMNLVCSTESIMMYLYSVGLYSSVGKNVILLDVVISQRRESCEKRELLRGIAK